MRPSSRPAMEANAVIGTRPPQSDRAYGQLWRGAHLFHVTTISCPARVQPMPVAPRVNNIEVRVPDLDPRHDGVRIAQLSDIHVGHMTPVSHVRAAIAAANEAQPDVIALTGDYVNWRRHEAGLAGEQLADLAAQRVVAVLGNHDYF